MAAVKKNVFQRNLRGVQAVSNPWGKETYGHYYSKNRAFSTAPEKKSKDTTSLSNTFARLPKSKK
ncbi:hypothetical protein [Desulfoluna spongiiphila]|uniref:hypothetical protein n=1 Tax=Desulfoluna spongiiphila TaxID=419481 RepID=UPI00125FC1C4|nr:hypothetical protein [Desulfoluna spongiiphila]